MTRLVTTILVAILLPIVFYLFIRASPLPYLQGVAAPFSLIVDIGIAVYAVWLNPRNNTRQ